MTASSTIRNQPAAKASATADPSTGATAAAVTPIEDYAIIGDTHTSALVSRTGSIDWLCLPRFDSPACFAALLGDADNGRWLISPVAAPTAIRRRYRPGSLVLETEFDTADGTVRLVDVMPPRDGRCDLIRRVEGVSGTVSMRAEFVVRFGYGKVRPWMRRISDEGAIALSAVAGPDAVCLRGDVELRAIDHRHAAEFEVAAGDHRDFSLTWYPSHKELPPSYHIDRALEKADRYWRRWAHRCTYTGPFRTEAVRSLLTLKALTYEPTGGIVAAVTTSLPEQFGGQWNWDYRYCWLRDAALTLRYLLDCGYSSEAKHWRQWLLRAIAGDPEDVQIMYGIAGERELREVELDWLGGYGGAAPVRQGNGAYTQYQSEIFGEVMDTLEAARQAGVKENETSWALQRALMGRLEQSWSLPDQGIWESRGDPQCYTQSRAMIWVAFDRAVRAVEQHGLEGPVDRWRELRDTVRAEVLQKGYDEELGAFTQYYGSKTLDASLLMLPIFGFLPATEARMARTITAIEKQLTVDHHVYRFQTQRRTSAAHGTGDGLPTGESSFLACSFWLAHCMALQGRTGEAKAALDALTGIGNDVGLFAEEYDPKQHRMAGNTPQALSHLALIGAVHAYGSACAR